MTEQRPAAPAWPPHLRPGAVRLAYSSGRYDETIAFYRDLVGLPVLAEFTDSFGEDGTVFGLPSVELHLEIVRSDTHESRRDPLELLALYFSGEQAAAQAAAPLESAGVPRDPAPHPYWAARGASVYVDPDGRRVVYAPWVFGVEPEPGASH